MVDADLAPLYDAVIACVDSDVRLVEAFIQDVKKNVCVDNKELAIERLSKASPSSQSKVEAVEEITDNSSYLIVFVSKNYIYHKKAFDKFVLEAVTCLSISEDRKCVLPLWVDLPEDNDIRLPFAISIYNGCKYSTTDQGKNDETWERLKSDFSRKADSMKHRKELREQHLKSHKKKQDLKRRDELKRAKEQQQSELEQVEQDCQRPVPMPRRKNSSGSSYDSVSRPIPAPRDWYTNHPGQVTVNINFTTASASLSTSVEAGEHQPSLRDSTMSSSTDRSSTLSSSSAEPRRTSTSSNPTVDGDRGSQCIINRSSDATDDWNIPEGIMGNEDSQSLNFTIPESLSSQAKKSSSTPDPPRRTPRGASAASASTTSRYADEISDLPTSAPTYSTAGDLPAYPRSLSEMHD